MVYLSKEAEIQSFSQRERKKWVKKQRGRWVMKKIRGKERYSECVERGGMEWEREREREREREGVWREREYGVRGGSRIEASSFHYLSSPAVQMSSFDF